MDGKGPINRELADVFELLSLSDREISPRSLALALSENKDLESFQANEVIRLLDWVEDELLCIELGKLAERMGAAMPTTFLIGILESEKSLQARQAAAYALGYSESDLARRPLERIAAHRSENLLLRGFAIEGLANLGYPESLDVLASIVAEEELEPSIAFWTAFALGELRDPRGIKPLQVLAQDKREGLYSKTVAEEALESLTLLGEA